MNNENPKHFHLIETFSGKTIAQADEPDKLKDEIQEKDAGNYTIHHDQQGWFAPATILFKRNSIQNND
ncbi:MAG: hypothetical protein JJU13_10280 [Balneolaceae bacterium]|nr:hypothetical protein [Balneolaceae bacterium]